MSVASRIQEIETHIGDIYDTLEVGGTDLTDLNKNIVNINSSLKDRYKYFLNNGVEVIWNNWEKVIGEGTEFTLENTIQAPMKVNLKGNTYQKSTTGKNLLDVPSSYSFKGIKSKNITLPAGTYYINCGNITKGGENNPFIVIPNVGGIALTQNLNRSFTLSSEITSVSFYSNGWDWNASQGITSTVENLMISTSGGDYEPYTGGNPSPNPDYPQDIQVVSGDNTIEVVGKNLFDKNDYSYYDGYISGTGTTYTPHQEESYSINLGDIELCKIGDYQDDFIRSSGKNLFDKNNYNSYDGYISGTGTVNIVSAANNNIVYIDCLPNTQYTVSKILSQRFRIGYSIDAPNSNVVVYGALNGDSQTSLTITTGSDAKYLVIYLRNGNLSNELSLETILNSLQIEKGNQVSIYEPYGKGKWYLHKEIGKHIITDSDISLISSYWYSTYGQYGAGIPKTNLGLPDTTTNRKSLCNVSNKIDGQTNIADNTYIFNANAKYVFFFGSSFDTKEHANEKLVGAEVYFNLDTPTTTEITDTTLLSQLEAIKYSYDDQTNISQVNNDMPFKLEVTALKNI